jgi:hypothetical protein
MGRLAIVLAISLCPRECTMQEKGDITAWLTSLK